MLYEVGLGDTPMRISKRLNGNPYRYFELLASNPHKKIVHVNGAPTFEKLGLGEHLILPVGTGFVDGVGVGNIFGDIVKVVTAPITAPIKAIAKVTAKIPVLGNITHIVSEAASAPANVAVSIASGERLDHVAMDALKAQLKIVKDVAPYATTVISFVPGIGSGVAAAIGAGAALAEGQSITDAIKSAVRSAIPGGPLVQAGFDVAMKVGSGENVAKAALESARGVLPPAAQKAFDIGLAVASGEKIQTALAKGLLSLAGTQLQAVLGAGADAIAKTPGLSDALKTVEAGPASEGFHLAAGLLSHAGINEKSLAAVRSQLPPQVVQGFDQALKSQIPHTAWLANVVSAPLGASPAQVALAQIAKLPIAQQQQLQAIAKLTPDQQNQLKQLAALTPDQQKALVAKVTAAATPHPAPKMPEPVRKVAMIQPKPVAPKPATPAPAPAPAPVATTATPKPPSAYAPYPPMGVSGSLSGCGDMSGATWGPPITRMSDMMQWAGRSAVHGSRGRPRMVGAPDGTTYLFSMDNGVLTARPQVG